ncbi:MAG: ATP-binding cassette domain-containing protein [Microbacteriaceae bacterium]
MKHEYALEFTNLSKNFGTVFAVKDLTFTVEPGKVTGLLGPNGSGKTTTLRTLLGLVKASAGTATIGGKAYISLDNAPQTVGAVLETNSFHPAHTARRHLRIQAAASGISPKKIDSVLEQVGMSDAADRKIGGYSLGMRQRLGLAAALLGDPQVLVMDEPINGLDPQGILWMRQLLKYLASEGRTVLISSHLLSEVEQTVENLVIINRGSLVYQGDISGLVKSKPVLIQSATPETLEALIKQSGHEYERTAEGFSVLGSSPEALGILARDAGIALSRLQYGEHGLEQSFFELIGGAQ